ncbi:MAG: Fe-S cluster assembly protein NifU [Syntrophales bacterium]|nr:Fe-S cluster assembly protein NifU [Syntrophales bacterium]MCK9528907.1 Fe-S cluster assembly protein NifU [Syntrophales bacterium]MDX9922630.1 Fe-S cluster assembly protein NifU [Syntrophales bacterium]
MWDYSNTVKDHFLNPRNVGEIEDPDGMVQIGSIACGDALKFMFKLGDDNRIKEARFKTFGCASAIASASALTEMVLGMTVEEAEKITNRDIAEYLGGLPDAKMHCSVLGRQALEGAIANYRGVPAPPEHQTIICECFGVTDHDIEQAIEENTIMTVEEVTNYTKAGGGCGTCHDAIDDLISRVRAEKRGAPKPRLSNLQKIKLIEETIDREISPSLKKDGGDLEIIDIIGNRVLLALRGSCATCPMSEQTMKGFVEAKLKELVDDDLIVEEIVE